MTPVLKLISWITLAAFLPTLAPQYGFAASGPFYAAPTFESQQAEINRVADQLAEALVTAAILDEKIEERGAALAQQTASEATATQVELRLLTAARNEAMAAARQTNDYEGINYQYGGLYSDDTLRNPEDRFHTANNLNLIFGRRFGAAALATAAIGATALTAGLAAIDPVFAQVFSQDPVNLFTATSLAGGGFLSLPWAIVLRLGAGRRSAEITQTRVFAALRARLIERGLTTVPDVLTPEWIKTASEKGLFYAAILHDPQRLNYEIATLSAALAELELELSRRGLTTQAQWARAMLDKVPASLGRTRRPRAIASWAQSAAAKYLDVRSATLQTLQQAQEIGLPADLITQVRSQLNQGPRAYSEAAAGTSQGSDGAPPIGAPDYRFHQNLSITTHFRHNPSANSTSVSLHTSLQSPELILLMESLAVEGKSLFIRITNTPHSATEVDRATQHLPQLHAFRVNMSIIDPNPVGSDRYYNAETEISMVVTSDQTLEETVRSSHFREALRPVLQNYARSEVTESYRRSLCNANLTLPPAQRVRVDAAHAAPGATSSEASGAAQQAHELDAAQPAVQQRMER